MDVYRPMYVGGAPGSHSLALLRSLICHHEGLYSFLTLFNRLRRSRATQSPCITSGWVHNNRLASASLCGPPASLHRSCSRTYHQEGPGGPRTPSKCVRGCDCFFLLRGKRKGKYSQSPISDFRGTGGRNCMKAICSK